MKLKHRLFLTAALFAVLFALSTPTNVLAQQNKNGLSITPLAFDYSFKPGDTKTDTVYLTNLSNQQLEISVEPRNFLARGEEGSVILTRDAIAYALANWITVTPNHIVMPSKEKVAFKFTITVPDNPEPGGHFGSIVFSTVPKKETKKSAAFLTQEVGALIFVKTPGEVKEKADIESFKTTFPFYEFGPIDFVTRVKNDSTVHIRPTGVITITDMFGTKETIVVDPKNVLPGAIRKLEAKWDKNILFGQYKATARYTWGSKGEVLTAETSFWAFPVRWGLLVLGVLIVVIVINTFVVLLIIRASQKRKEKRNK
jgi:hypothetical protein